MVGEGPVADLDPGIQDAGRVETPLHPDEQFIQLGPEHLPDIFGPHPTIAVLPANRSVEPLQHRPVNLVIALNHRLKVLPVIHVQQRDDMGVAVSDMPEDGNRHTLAPEEFLQIPDELADPLRTDHDVVDEIDRFFPRIETIERGIERLAGFP